MERKLDVDKNHPKMGLKSVYLELFGIFFFAFSGLDSDQARCGFWFFFWSLAALGKHRKKNKKQEKKKKKRKKKEIYMKYINI